MIEKLYQIRSHNIEQFRRLYPHLKNLHIKQILLIFRLYVANTKRDFDHNNDHCCWDHNNVSFLVAGTLIILITSLFIAAGMPMGLSADVDPNEIVMNSVIAAGSSGLLVALRGQYQNLKGNKDKHTEGA